MQEGGSNIGTYLDLKCVEPLGEAMVRADQLIGLLHQCLETFGELGQQAATLIVDASSERHLYRSAN